MPVVPRYDAPRIQPSPIPSARFSPDAPQSAFQPPQPVDFSGVEKVAAKIHEDETRKADQVAVMSAQSEMAAKGTELLYGPNGIMHREGQNAFGAPEEALGEWTKTVGGIEKGLTTDEQRMAFRKLASEEWQAVDRAVQSHVGSERQKYADGQFNGLLVNTRNAAVATFTDPQAIASAIQTETAATLQYGKVNGWSNDMIEAKVSEAVSLTHLGVINRMVDSPGMINGVDGDQAAQQYYDAHKDQIAGTQRGEIEKTLEEGTLRGESQRRSDAIMKKYPTETEADSAVKAITDPKLRDETQKRVDYEWARRREVQRNDRNDLYLQAGNLIDSYPGMAANRAVPSYIWKQLAVGEKSALESYAKRSDTDGGEGTQNNKLYLQYLDLSPEEVGRMNQNEFQTKYWQYFDKSHRAKAETDWKSARDKARSGGGKTFTETEPFKALVMSGLTKSGLIDPQKKLAQLTQSEATLPVRAVDLATDLLHQAEASKGSPLNPVEQQKVVDQAVMQLTFGRGGGAIPLPAEPNQERMVRTLYGRAKIVTDEQGVSRTPIGQIPEKRVAEIKKHIQGRVTNDKIERAYAAFASGDAQRFDAIMKEQ